MCLSGIFDSEWIVVFEMLVLSEFVGLVFLKRKVIGLLMCILY